MRRALRILAALAFLIGLWSHAHAQVPMTGAGKGAPTVAVTAQSIVTASSGSQYITTTWSHAPTDVKKATIAYWQKFTVSPTSGNLYAFTTAANSSTLFDHKYNGSSQHYNISDDISSAYALNDFPGFTPGTTDWHHICIQIDTTAGTPVHIWVDGVDAGTSGTQPTLNSNMQITANGIASYIGTVSYVLNGIDSKWAYVYLIDGQALTPSSFTTGTGVGSIHPITYGGTYGANGFFLNGNGGTSGSVPDQSGNGNNFTAPNNITFSADLPT